MNRKVTFKETVELFINKTIYDIVNETEIPRINFIFNDNAYKLFYDIMKNPFKLDNAWTPNIKEEDITFLKNSINYNYPSIFVKDHTKFFTYLTEITNHTLKMYDKYNEPKMPRQYLIYILKRIWLRMGPNDLNNIEEFLYKQLIFSIEDIFEEYKYERKKYHTIDTYHNLTVIAENTLNKTWDESTKCMLFKILTDTNFHSLPSIYYDSSDKTCYIYAIQNDKKPNKLKEIDKLLYKDFRSISQPNKVYSLKLFINMLKEKGIKNIKVPTIQILNYDYHNIISKKEKKEFNKKWPKDYINYLSNFEQIDYENDLLWYNHVVDKEDTISKIKTEDLINLIYKIVNEDNELEIINDIDISDTLDIKIKSLKL